MSRILLLQGNQAVVEGAIAAGVKFYGGYPITPSTEIAEQLALRLPQVGGKFMQTEDEIAGTCLSSQNSRYAVGEAAAMALWASACTLCGSVE